jgi:DNA invertase Pin-like site-specific DNA recombinase
MKAVGYVRVSTDTQENARQVEAIKNECARLNYNLLEIFHEIESGKNRIRPELTKMETYLESNLVDFVVISELSRLGRTNEVLKTIDKLSEKKIGLISIKESIRTLSDDKSPDEAASLLISILTGINSYELATLKFRTRDGALLKIKEGGVNGGANIDYGYRNDKKKMVIEESEAKVIRDIYRKYLEGSGKDKIADWLNNEKVPTRWKLNINKKIEENKQLPDKTFLFRWYDVNVDRILKNSIYMGVRKYKGKLLDYNKNFEIIDEDTFNKVQNRLKERRNTFSSSKKHLHLLKRKIYCGFCGMPYYSITKLNDKRNKPKYVCLSKRYKELQCSNTSIPIDKLEDLIQQVILYRLAMRFKSMLKDTNISQQIEAVKEELIKLNNDKKIVIKQQQKLIKHNVNELIDDNTFAKNIKPINNQIKSIDNTILLKNTELSQKIDTLENITDISKIKLRFLDGHNLDGSIVNTIISKITLTKIDDKPACFTNKQDNVVEVKIVSGTTELKYLISQRAKGIYDIQADRFFDRLTTNNAPY